MKKSTTIFLVSACIMMFFVACEKELKYISPTVSTEGLAFIKIVHASPNFRQVYKGADSFNVYTNQVKLNGPQLTYNSLFPIQNSLYAAVPAGQHSLRITINGKTTPDSVTLATLNKTLEANSYYSFIITDEALTANESRQMWIKDNFTLTDTTRYTLRFVNAVLNDAGSVDVYSFRNASKIFSAVAPGSNTPFIALPHTFLTDTLYVRAAGTLTDIAKIAVLNGSTSALNKTRAYTLLYKGMVGGTGAKVRNLTIYTNN